MDVAIPHTMGREEARRRMRANSASLGDTVPAGMAEVTASWPSDDRMALAISAMGQSMEGHVDIEDDRLVFHLDLPMTMMLFAPMVESMVKDQGHHLLAAPKE